VDLNGDVGEARVDGPPGADLTLIPHITSANIACGFHAGNPGVMRATVRKALEHGVAVGAHPSFPDPDGFGRRELQFAPRDVEDFVSFQIGTIAAIAAVEGVRLQHVKPHGALFNMAAHDEGLAESVARAAATIDRGLILLGPPGSALIDAGRRQGLRTAREGFADRAYQTDGTLVPRSSPGAVIHDGDAVVRRAVRMVRDQVVETIDGRLVPLVVDTLCVHGDTPGASELAARVRAGLEAEGIDVIALARP
jgi:UPF0271 protein